ncbi:microsomal signal peptidase 12 kDa subunit [Actinidia rufa]|uniref:Microsomal signal peptidase 12 kDa subunit n=1 Tax=Actinidia rufa TaxID=165716 RepID=A0A7J0FN16_9ERIC|nr:microsomal signal peptidase 12 kDa subunit [Actinidia rufa]
MFNSTKNLVDGLARAEASGAVDADSAAGFCGGGICIGLCLRLISDNAANIHLGGSYHYFDHCSQLALLSIATLSSGLIRSKLRNTRSPKQLVLVRRRRLLRSRSFH